MSTEKGQGVGSWLRVVEKGLLSQSTWPWLFLLTLDWAHGVGHAECGSGRRKAQCLETFCYMRKYRLWKYCMKGNDRCVWRRAVVQQGLNFPGLVTASLIPTYHQRCSALMQHCMLTSVCTSACTSHNMVHPWLTRGLFLTQEREGEEEREGEGK